MNRYDYKCEEHGFFEVECKMSETTPTHPCPVCGKESPKMIISAPPIGFKGAGWTSQKPKTIDTSDRDWIKRHQKERWD